jgi:hypothetical protein
VALAALAQLALAAAGYTQGVPLAPLAVLAAWAVVRNPFEAWSGLLPAPLLLGLASDDRAGWVLIALAPTPLIAAALQARHSAIRTVAAAVATAAAGAAICALVLAGAHGALHTLAGTAAINGVSILLTGLLAAPLAVLLLPFRVRERGLFA